jgi:hypothetical protein
MHLPHFRSLLEQTNIKTSNEYVSGTFVLSTTRLLKLLIDRVTVEKPALLTTLPRCNSSPDVSSILSLSGAFSRDHPYSSRTLATSRVNSSVTSRSPSRSIRIPRSAQDGIRNALFVGALFVIVAVVDASADTGFFYGSWPASLNISLESYYQHQHHDGYQLRHQWQS